MITYAALANLYACYSERNDHLLAMQNNGATFAEQEFALRQLLSLRDMIEAAEAEISSDYTAKNPVEVYYEPGYRWSINIEGESEVRYSDLTKVEAMCIARKIAKHEGRKIKEQKLTKAERKTNMSSIWEFRRELGWA